MNATAKAFRMKYAVHANGQVVRRFHHWTLALGRFQREARLAEALPPGERYTVMIVDLADGHVICTT